MKLFELESHLKAGKGIRRLSWEPKQDTLYLSDRWSILVESLFADDWIGV